jgi:methylglutaconyl-CoA hydratase
MVSAPVQIDFPGEAIARITLNRPEKRNALNIEMMELLLSALQDFRERFPEIRALIIRGAPPIFCPGLDLTEAADPVKGEMMARLVGSLFVEINAAPFLTVAAVEGAALAGGAGIALACDIVIANEGARWGFPEVLRGLVPAQVSALVLRSVQGRTARELLLYGDTVDSTQALAVGLINQVVPTAEMPEAAIAAAVKITHAAPGAVAATKSLLRELEGLPLADELALALPYFLKARASAEAIQGQEAFFTKRSAPWQP